MTDRHKAALRAALAKRDRLFDRGGSYLPARELRQCVEAALAAADAHPHYTSTYCIHDLHDDCRLTCKHCEAPCRCECHTKGDQ